MESGGPGINTSHLTITQPKASPAWCCFTFHLSQSTVRVRWDLGMQIFICSSLLLSFPLFPVQAGEKLSCSPPPPAAVIECLASGGKGEGEKKRKH